MPTAERPWELTKRCNRCGETRPVVEFYRHRETGDGFDVECKACKKAACTARRARIKSDPDMLRQERARRREEKHRERARGHIYKPDPVKHKLSTYRWRTKHPEKYSAQKAIKNAIKRGALIQRPCEVCGCQQVDGHHPDYTKPLEVRWLCRRHHLELHRKD